MALTFDPFCLFVQNHVMAFPLDETCQLFCKMRNERYGHVHVEANLFVTKNVRYQTLEPQSQF